MQGYSKGQKELGVSSCKVATLEGGELFYKDQLTAVHDSILNCLVRRVRTETGTWMKNKLYPLVIVNILQVV